MSSINGIGSNSPIQKLATPAAAGQAAPTSAGASTSRPADSVNLTGTGQTAAATAAGSNFRADKVAAIKAQIQNGTYDESHKLDIAADRMLDEIMR